MNEESMKKMKSSCKKINFPKILLGSQKLRDKINAKAKQLKSRKKKLKSRLVCEKCGERFPTWWEIREHWQSSGHKDPEECRWCRKKTYALQSHLCKEHWNMACMCTYCGQLFMFREGLKVHERRHNGLEYRCYLCGKKQKTQDLLRKHIYKHYVYERYGCNVCEKRFKKKKNVEKHLKSVHFICQYCGSSCENKEQLIKHWKVHDDLKCVLCHKVFSQKNRLKYHYQMQHGHQDFYKCSLCFQRFPLKSKLLDHLKLKHKGYAKISCETCEMPFLYWSQYLNHFEQVHVKSQEKFLCSFCDFSTNVRSKLQWHVEKTSGDGFFCKFCQIRSQCKTKFDEHMKIHEGKRIFNCDYCEKNFATADILKYHLSVMHQEVIIMSKTKGHPCCIAGCNRYYTSKSSLARHMRRNHMESGVSCSSGQYCADNTVECRFPLTLDKKAFQQCHEETVVSSSTQPCPDEPEAPLPDEPEAPCPDEPEAPCPDEPEAPSTEEPIDLRKSGFEEGIVSESLSTVSYSRTERTKNKKNSVEQTNGSDRIEVDVYYCDICCKFWFTGDKQFRKHMTTHFKQVWDDECAECEEILETPEDAVRHYVEDHLKAEYDIFRI